MSEECCPPEGDATTCEAPAALEKALCPSCHQPGKPVDGITLKAMLAVPLTELSAAEYRFCRTPSCPTVYYNVDGRQQFVEADLRERVYQKHPDADDIFVCYCFRHSPATIREELLATSLSSVVEHVTAGVKAGQCACEVRNPQGACCLGNVRAVVQRVEAELQRRETPDSGGTGGSLGPPLPVGDSDTTVNQEGNMR